MIRAVLTISVICSPLLVAAAEHALLGDLAAAKSYDYCSWAHDYGAGPDRSGADVTANLRHAVPGRRSCYRSGKILNKCLKLGLVSQIYVKRKF